METNNGITCLSADMMGYISYGELGLFQPWRTTQKIGVHQLQGAT